MSGPDVFGLDTCTATRLLGEGLWGRVYDLGDGTVLKIAREKCAGIGSGRQKIENEHAALRLLSATGALEGLVPAARGHGDIPSTSPLAHEGFVVWLRATRIEGRGFSPEEIGRLPSREQAAIGREIGVALARLHRALGDAVAAAGMTLPAIGGAAAYAAIASDAREIGDPFYVDAIARLIEARSHIAPAILARPAHGDFNISNLMFAPDGSVCGILDFAEWGADFPEQDLSDTLHDLPALAADLVPAYESASGFPIGPARLALGNAENALIGAIIGARKGDREAVEWERDQLRTALKHLAAWRMPSPSSASSQ